MFGALLLCGVLGFVVQAHSAVLDPALYLLPSPPLVTSSDSISPEERWKMSESTRVTRDADNLDPALTDQKQVTTIEKSESMEGAETFWPGVRTPAYYGIRGIHIPLTFGITGTYGSAGSIGAGVIGSSYASVSTDDTSFGSYGKSALAGSSYGSYGSYPGVRVFGGGSKQGWSGWGNGKWGNYGKG
ncbi:hypothetical protein evm_011605 [Chilo suppressalis]|nr:hypothetical protein evm_011605 [Chilo suppressalis]